MISPLPQDAATIEFKRYVAGKMELERADKRFFPDKPKAMGDMVAREKSNGWKAGQAFWCD